MRFVLIDRFLELEPGKRALASKTFSPEESFLADHFPGFPVVPGVLLTEAMGQTGGWLLAASLGTRRWPLLTMISSAKFRRLVLPGEEILLDAALRSAHESDFEVRAGARVGKEQVAEARLVFHAFELPLPPAELPRSEAWAGATWDAIGGGIVPPPR